MPPRNAASLYPPQKKEKEKRKKEKRKEDTVSLMRVSKLSALHESASEDNSRTRKRMYTHCDKFWINE